MKHLIKKILTEERSLDKITDVLLYEDDYGDSPAQSILKLFGGDWVSLYHFIDAKGRGLEFLEHLQNRVYSGGMYLVDVLQMGPPTYSKEDMDLFMTWIFPMWDGTTDGLRKGELTRKGDRILLEIPENDQTQLFGGDSQDIAEIVFNPEEMPMELNFQKLDVEDLINYMTEENFIGLVRYIGIHNQNEEVDAWREEFDSWREEDQLPDGKVFLTLNRMNGFLDGDRYNLVVLLGNTPELEDILNEVEWVYSDSYNWVYENEYRKMYHYALEGLIGTPVGKGEKENWRASSGDKSVRNTTPTNFYDVTDLLSTILWQATKDGEDPGQSTAFDLIRAHKGYLTPGEPYEPDEDDEEIIEIYNDDLKNLFS